MLPSASTANVVRNAPVKNRYALLLLVASLVVVADQVTKELALSNLADRPIDLIDGVLTLGLHYNSGGAFGFMQSAPGFFLIATLVVAAGILMWAHKIEGTAHLIPLGLVLGGGLGNVADRVFRDTGGRVVDFIDLHVWPVFNIADSMICIGVVWLLIATAREKEDT